MKNQEARPTFFILNSAFFLLTSNLPRTSKLSGGPRATSLRRQVAGAPAAESAALLRRDVRCGDSAIHEEGRSVYVRRFVAGQEERGVGDLLGASEASHRDVHQAALASG